MDRNALGYLTDLNRAMDTALSLMEKLAEYPELNHEDFIVYQSCFREYLADTNLTVLDALEEFEQGRMLKANRERVTWEKKIRDPDDCYLEAKSREEELRQQGKPSQIGILLGMRRWTREEIMSSSFEEEEDDQEMAREGESKSDAEQTENGGRRP